MSERESILARVREALTVPSPLPGHEAGGTHPAPGLQRVHNARQWLPLVGETFQDRVALFEKNAVELRAGFHLVSTRDELCKLLTKLRDAEAWKKVGLHGGEMTDEVSRVLELPACRTDQGYDVNEMEGCDAGITECDALVAQTGSVLVTSRSAGGRALSVLPPHHVVLARREQLVSDLPEAFALLKRKYGQNYPSFISLITGPSRTGDIERILVLGAHGPKKLSILCL